MCRKKFAVAPGTRVVWLNKDDEDHTVTSATDPKLLDSPNIAKGDSFEFTFSDPGTYPYLCTIHDGMNGVVIVE